MPGQPLRRRNYRVAPVIIYFAMKFDERKGKKRPCVYAQCKYSQMVVGPEWTHCKWSIWRALEKLSQRCRCPAREHKVRIYEGHCRRSSVGARRTSE